jgi:hypothetical protein
MKLVRIGKQIINMDAVTLILIHDEEPDNYSVTLQFAVPPIETEEGIDNSGWGFNGAEAKMFIGWLNANAADIMQKPASGDDGFGNITP